MRAPLRPFRRFSLALVLLGIPVLALGQWSDDPSLNLTLGDGAGDQVQPKLVPTPDGGCYLSWFSATGYDVRLQRLDAMGQEVWAHNGVLVADRGFSSTQDYSLGIDAAGNALLAFRDDRFSGTQITAARVEPDGTLSWGANGVQLTSTGEFVAAPKIAGTADGSAVVAWTQDVNTRVQRLSPAGATEWTNDAVLAPGTGSYSASDLHGAGEDAVLSFVHQTGGFGSPRHLLAQKFDADGALLWGPGHVAVFDGGSLQFGNFPIFVPDGSGGGVFSWYDAASTQLQCSVQRILSDGTEAFGHNGVPVSTNVVRVRVSPSVSFDPVGQIVYAFWREQNSSQSQSGVFGQKFDAVGTRLWTDNGAQVEAVSSIEIGSIQTWSSASGPFVFWSRIPAFGQDRLYGARVVAADGSLEIGPFDVASTPSGKSRLQVAPSTSGFAVLVWQDGRVDGSDVYGQNVNPDGSLGPASAEVGGGDPVRGGEGLLAAPWPNPVRDRVVLTFRAPAPVASRLAIVDVQGRVLRAWSGPELVGQRSLTWDLRDVRGSEVPAGVYFVRRTGPDGSESMPLTVIR